MDNPVNNGSLGSSDGNGESAWYPNLSGNPGSGGNINAWFNQQAYASPAINTFGTNKRNSLVGPDFVWFDFSMGKSFSMPGWERGKLQIRMDANNVFNHPALKNPASCAQSPSLLPLLGRTDRLRQKCRRDHRNRRKRSNDYALGPILVLRRIVWLQ